MLVPQRMLPIAEPSQVAAARRVLREFAQEAGLSEVEAGNAAIALTEAATNMLKHAAGGELVLRLLGEPAAGVEILAIDGGPGMDDWNRSMRDGYTTGRSPGTGLGAICRLAHQFDVYTRAGQGSVLRMVFWRDGIAPPSRFEIGVVCLPVMGETECGDGWACHETAAGCMVMVADGLGHGPDAALASRAATALLGGAGVQTLPVALLEKAHGALRATRGAAMAAAYIEQDDTRATRIRFAGVGNVAAGVHRDGGSRQFAPFAGIVGHNMRKTQEAADAWDAGCLLIMYSDGLVSHWSLDKYPGLAMRHPGVIAAVLYRDLARGRDDVTVLVVRHKGS